MSREELDLEGLSDEERAALADVEPEDDTPADDDAIADVDPDAEPDDEGEGNDEAEAEAPAPAAPATPEPAPVAEPAPEAEPAPATPAVDHGAQVKEAQDALAALKTQFAEGDIDVEEFTAEFERLSGELRTAEVAHQVAEQGAQREQEAAGKAWESAQDRFMGQEGNAIFDRKSPQFNDVLFDAMDVQVQKLSRDPAAANWSYDKLLTEASNRVKQAFNLDKPATKPPKRTPVELPPNLGKVPAAVPNAQGGRFDHLDAMDGLELEAAIAKMSDAEREDYERGA